MKLQGDKNGRKGQLSVATEVMNYLIQNVLTYLFPRLHGISLLLGKKMASSKTTYRMFKLLINESFQVLFNYCGYKLSGQFSVF